MTTTPASRPVRRRAALVAGLALAAAACSGTAAEGGSAVAIRDNAYQPADLEVATGSTVTWTNDDEAPHTVTFSGSGPASSEQLAEGDGFTTTFDTAGTFPYVCTLHPEMEATVTVTG